MRMLLTGYATKLTFTIRTQREAVERDFGTVHPSLSWGKDPSLQVFTLNISLHGNNTFLVQHSDTYTCVSCFNTLEVTHYF